MKAPRSRSSHRETDLFSGELRCVRQDEVDGELSRDRRRDGGAGLHEGERSLGGLDVRDDLLPGLVESGVSRSVACFGDLGGEGTGGPE